MMHGDRRVQMSQRISGVGFASPLNIFLRI
jgi:hypothetical protein